MAATVEEKSRRVFCTDDVEAVGAVVDIVTAVVVVVLAGGALLSIDQARLSNCSASLS